MDGLEKLHEQMERAVNKATDVGFEVAFTVLTVSYVFVKIGLMILFTPVSVLWDAITPVRRRR